MAHRCGEQPIQPQKGTLSPLVPLPDEGEGLGAGAAVPKKDGYETCSYGGEEREREWVAVDTVGGWTYHLGSLGVRFWRSGPGG